MASAVSNLQEEARRKGVKWTAKSEGADALPPPVVPTAQGDQLDRERLPRGGPEMIVQIAMGSSRLGKETTSEKW